MSSSPFAFYTNVDLIFLTNRRARNLKELLKGIKESSGSVIYYHTHRFLRQHHYLSPEPPNDFAFWTSNVLLERVVGEKLAAIDIVSFPTIRELREKIVSVLEENISNSNNLRESPEGMEFHFMSSKSFILSTGLVACNLEEFYEIVKRITIYSLYFHMFQARLRLGRIDNDFSIWLRDQLKEFDLAEKISRLDPYTWTLEGLRNKICNLIEERLYGKT